MLQPPLDDPREMPRPPRSHLLSWWMVGLGMGMVLLLINLLDQEGKIPAIGGLASDWIAGLLFLAVMVSGPLVLAQMLEKAEPGISPLQSGRNAYGSGVLSATIFLFIKVAVGRSEHFSNWWSNAIVLLLAGGFTALIGAGYTVFQRRRGWWYLLLLLALWLGLVLLALGSPWFML